MSKLQRQTEIREKLRKTLMYAKAACKVLVKLTRGKKTSTAVSLPQKIKELLEEEADILLARVHYTNSDIQPDRHCAYCKEVCHVFSLLGKELVVTRKQQNN